MKISEEEAKSLLTDWSNSEPPVALVALLVVTPHSPRVYVRSFNVFITLLTNERIELTTEGPTLFAARLPPSDSAYFIYTSDEIQEEEIASQAISIVSAKTVLGIILNPKGEQLFLIEPSLDEVH